MSDVDRLRQDIAAFWAEEDQKVAAQIAAQTAETERPEPTPEPDSTSEAPPMDGTFTVDWAAEHLPASQLVYPYAGLPGAQYTVEGASAHLEPRTLLVAAPELCATARRSIEKNKTLGAAHGGPAGALETARVAPLEERVRALEDAVQEMARYTDALNAQLGASAQRDALLARALCAVLLGEQAPQLSYAELGRLMDLAAQAE